MILQLEKMQLSDDLCRLELRGRLTMGNDSRQVEWTVAEMLNAGVKKVILDLQNLETVDSTGVGILVVCHARLQKAGGTLCIAGAQGLVLDTLLMTHIDRIVQFFPSASAAAENFLPA